MTKASTAGTKTVLVCGGAGYIGSHMCKALARRGYAPVVYDNLSTGHGHAVKWGPLVVGDLLDPATLALAFATYRIDAVMHFAARSIVSESVRDPASYYRDNVVGTLNLLDAMRRAGVQQLVFSSSAAVYGCPAYTPVDEAHPCQPITPYGWSKRAAESAIEAYCKAYALSAASLRYFNAAGADADGEIGEEHDPETHLIPNIVAAALSGSEVRIFGDDYPTPDGTCVRDYVHVEDLCDAHLLALDHLSSAPGWHVFNLGSGSGHSVGEVLAACRARCNGAPDAAVVARREGDPAILVAGNAAARTQLRWEPRRSLTECVDSALRWHGRAQ
jgi:UDP-glucose-4-epimerase GalE